MGKQVLINCMNCGKPFGIDKKQYNSIQEDIKFRAVCPYCKFVNMKNGLKKIEY